MLQIHTKCQCNLFTYIQLQPVAFVKITQQIEKLEILNIPSCHSDRPIENQQTNNGTAINNRQDWETLKKRKISNTSKRRRSLPQRAIIKFQKKNV